MPKYNNIFTLTVLATVVALSACQPKQDEPKRDVTPPEVVESVPEQTKLEGETEKLVLAIPECDGKNCPEINIERLKSNQPFIDEFIDQQILSQLKDVLSVDAIEPVIVNTTSETKAASDVEAEAFTAKQKLEQQTTPYMQTFLNLDKELKALSANHSISVMIKPKILNADAPLATVVLNSTHYLGGAHGSTAQNYYNFDLEQKKQIKLDDILLDKQKLEAVAHEAFKAWVIDSKLATDITEYEQAWKFVLTDNFYLTQQGLALQYAEYEIGPYVVGLPRLMLPYDKLQGVLKPEYLPQTEKTASASSAQVVEKSKE